MTKDITLYPESETLIVSLVYEPDTGYLRAVYEQAKTWDVSLFLSYIYSTWLQS